MTKKFYFDERSGDVFYVLENTDTEVKLNLSDLASGGGGGGSGESPNAEPQVIEFSNSSDGFLGEALNEAMALAQLGPVDFVIDGVIPLSKVHSGPFFYTVELKGNLSNLRILGKSENTKSIYINPIEISSVVSCDANGDGYSAVVQTDLSGVTGLSVGGFLLFQFPQFTNPLPNNSWRGVAGCYEITDVDLVNNRITFYLVNDVPLTLGATTVLAGYCGNVIESTVFNSTCNMITVGQLGLNGGGFTVNTQSTVNVELNLCMLGGQDDTPCEVSGRLTSENTGANLYFGISSGASPNLYAAVFLYGHGSLAINGIFSNNADNHLNVSNSSRVSLNLIEATNANSALYSELAGEILVSQVRIHNSDTAVEVFSGGKCYFDSGATLTSVTTPYSITTGTFQTDGSVIFLI